MIFDTVWSLFSGTLIFGSPPGLWLTWGASVSMSTSALSSICPLRTCVQALSPACRRTPRMRSICNRESIHETCWLSEWSQATLVSHVKSPQCPVCWPRWEDWSRSVGSGHPRPSECDWGFLWMSCFHTYRFQEIAPPNQSSPQSVGDRPPESKTLTLQHH